MSEYGARLSKLLPESLGSLFTQPAECEARPSSLPEPPANLPGAFAAPELCTLVEPYRPELLTRDALAEVKIDGLRCIYIAGRLWTREGSPFEAAEHCLPLLQALESAYGVPMFFDGEYVEDGGVEATLSAFRSRRGAGVLWLFDAVPFDQWRTGEPSRETLEMRKQKLRMHVLRVNGARSGAAVGYVEHLPMNGACQIERQAQALWGKGYEGLVVKSASARYVRKRTCDWMKVKLRSVSDMMVVDILGCTRDGRETAKALIVRLPAEGSRPMRLAVRGGIAETLWDHRGNVIGERVKVEHAGFTGGGQPREATLKEVTL